MRFRLKNKSYVLNTKIKLVGKNDANLSIITSDINNPTSNYNLIANTITFCLSPLPAVIGDPEVIVNQYTTAALDFENGLIDKIPTTVWTKEGTADITPVNKIFGQNSFETKALGDSLYTNSNIITGGSTPFTIEFYALVKSSQGFNQYVTLLTKKNNIDLSNFNVLIIDTIGILTKIYSNADIAYVGGGFGNPGVHNILEPVTFGVPVVIGRNYSHFAEATALVNMEGCISIQNQTQLNEAFDLLLHNEDERLEKGHICSTFVQMNKGATQTIMHHILG